MEIPEKALREILLNGIVHRNYHIQAPTKIAIYDNRIEIFSPGVFPGPSFSSKPRQTESETDKILTLFEVTDEIAISDVMRALNLSRPTAGRRLAELSQQGILEQVGKSKATRFECKNKIYRTP